MALPKLFSRRSRPAKDVYFYTSPPEALRVQILHVLVEAVGPSLGSYTPPPGAQVYESILRTLRKDLGVFILTEREKRDPLEELAEWFLNCDEVDRVIDFIELACRGIDEEVRGNEYKFREHVQNSDVDDALDEINARMREAGFGYTYEAGQMLRIDSQLVHAEVVLPALGLLADARFRGANKEYLAAHEAYRRGDGEAAIVECGKAFESVLKVIGAKRGWKIGANDPAKRLIDAAFASGFIEPFLQAEFTALRSLLESGVPAVRNRQGGHGAGGTPRKVPQQVVAFQLHQTAAAIVFLAEHDRNSR